MVFFKKFIQSVVSLWHGYLSWWHSIPQAKLAKRLMSLYQLFYGSFKLAAWYFFWGIPLKYFVTYYQDIPFAKLNIAMGMYMLVILLLLIPIAAMDYKVAFIRKVAAWLGLSLYPTLFYLTPSVAMTVKVYTDVFLTSLVVITITIIIAIIKFLITKSVNQDFHFVKGAVHYKVFDPKSIWRQYEATEVTGNIYQSSESNKLLNIPKPVYVNRLAYVAQTANLPLELIQLAKQFDQEGRYTLPTLKLQTGFPFYYNLAVNIDYRVKIISLYSKKQKRRRII